MSMQSKLKTRGILMLVSFLVLLGIIFMPVFPGKVNGLDYMDNLFNMVSKGSSYFIPKALEETAPMAGKEMEMKLAMKSANQASQIAKMLTVSGAQATASGSEVQLKGDIRKILASSLEDADKMFQNNGKPIADKYGFAEKEAMYNWHVAFGKISSDLTAQQKFDAAKQFANVQKRALEPAYNYFGIEAMNWKDNIGLIIAALAFYVFYTLWYGFGLMYLFEGIGLKIGH